MKTKCPVLGTIEFVAQKWTLIILRYLQLKKKMRFNEFLKELDRISSRTLSKRLAGLEKKGMIQKKIYPEIPPHVEYSLTQKGEEFTKTLTDIAKWCEKWETQPLPD